MFSAMVGSVDLNAAIVLIAMFACIGVVLTTLIARHRNQTQVANEFALKTMEQEAENARYIYAAETDRNYKFKQLDQNLITSHRQE